MILNYRLYSDSHRTRRVTQERNQDAVLDPTSLRESRGGSSFLLLSSHSACANLPSSPLQILYIHGHEKLTQLSRRASPLSIPSVTRPVSGDTVVVQLSTPSPAAMGVPTSPPLQPPASASMVRKRSSPSTDHETDQRDPPSPSSSIGSHTSIPSLAISPSPETSTTSSSPMVRRSSSSRSLCSAFQQAFDTLDSDEEDVEPALDRPKMKRRKTGSSSSGGSLSSRRGSHGKEKKGHGKDGEDVWTPDLEEAYHRGKSDAAKE